MSDKAAAILSPTETIECPLCCGAGKLKRTEVLDRLGVKDFARVATLSAEEASRIACRISGYEEAGRRYEPGLRGHLKAVAFMVIGFVLSAAAMLYVAQSARDDSDSVWFITAYVAVFSSIIILAVWRALMSCFRRIGGV